MADLHVIYDSFEQSPWLDNLSRLIINNGSIKELIDSGIRGLTSNPTIFEKAFSDSDVYDQAIAESGLNKSSAQELYWQLAIADIQHVADLLRPVYDQSHGQDGYVSLEVSPELAHDAEATFAQAQELWQKVDRPNLMVKVPATIECVPVVQRLISLGININVTLIFSLERYHQVAEAFLAGLEAKDGDLSSIHSVASFFVSRVDTEVDARLQKLDGDVNLTGKAAIAQAQVAYNYFLQSFGPNSQRWQNLLARGAHEQRPLWASTSVKNPDYDPLMYVKALLAPRTVNTMPNVTIESIQHAPYNVFHDETGIDDAKMQQAEQTLNELAKAGIEIDDVTDVLEVEGVNKFHESFTSMLDTLASKMPK